MGMHKNKFFRNTLGILASFVVFTGCSSDGPVIEQPEQQYYEIAQSRMRAKNYFSAIDALEMIVTRYPFGRYAEQAQSELIYVHFMNGDDEAAHAATEKFIRLHPRHPNIDYAYFMRGITSYTRDKSFFARLFEDNLPKAFELAEEVENISLQYITSLKLGKPKILSIAEMNKVLSKAKNYKKDS